MSDRRNLKVKPVTHEAIKAEQHAGETIDDTLQRVLGVSATPDDIENGIAAYLPPEMQQQICDHVELIREIGDFEENIKEGDGIAGSDALDFVDKDSGLRVARVECGDDPASYIVRYRDNEGELDNVFGTVYDDDSDIDHKKNLSRVDRLVQGALNRWGGT